MTHLGLRDSRERYKTLGSSGIPSQLHSIGKQGVRIEKERRGPFELGHAL